MASITIRSLDEDLKRRLCVRAAEEGCSIEEEAHEILRQALRPSSAPGNLGHSIHVRFAAIDGVSCAPVHRSSRRPLPDLE